MRPGPSRSYVLFTRNQLLMVENRATTTKEVVIAVRQKEETAAGGRGQAGEREGGYMLSLIHI